MNRSHPYYLWLSALVWLLISGCDPEEPIPSYLSINSVRVENINPSQHGSISSNIKDVWVYVDNELLGVYELPARFPVLKEGVHEVQIGAGIYENGIAATRIKYPLYASYTADVDFKPGATVQVPEEVVINYFPGIKYSWFESFEGPVYEFDSIAGSKAGFTPFSNDDPFEGNFSGKFSLNTTKNYFLGACIDTTIDINNFSTAWVELNYRADQKFNVGIMVKKNNNTTTREYALTVNSSPSWNKIYINVSDIIGSYRLSAAAFRVYVEAELDAGLTESTIHLDNIKLIHN